MKKMITHTLLFAQQKQVTEEGMEMHTFQSQQSFSKLSILSHRILTHYITQIIRYTEISISQYLKTNINITGTNCVDSCSDSGFLLIHIVCLFHSQVCNSSFN